MKTRSQKRWYVVADVGRATAWVQLAHGATFTQAAAWTSVLSLPSDQQPDATDKPGRLFDSLGGQRHAAETVPPKELLKQAFGRELAQALNKAHANGAFEGLVLFAAPRFLHVLREHLDKATASAVVHSEAKDFTSLPEQELFDVFETVPDLAGKQTSHRLRTTGGSR
jgi:protein required for attachment to host cells